MEYFRPLSAGRTLLLRFDRGDLLLEGIAEALARERMANAVVLSGIGTLDRCVLHMVTTTGFPPVEHFARWEDEPLELAAVQGLVIGGRPHLRAVVSDRERAYAGHLENGCRVLYLAEIAGMKLEGGWSLAEAAG